MFTVCLTGTSFPVFFFFFYPKIQDFFCFTVNSVYSLADSLLNCIYQTRRRPRVGGKGAVHCTDVIARVPPSITYLWRISHCLINATSGSHVLCSKYRRLVNTVFVFIDGYFCWTHKIRCYVIVVACTNRHWRVWIAWRVACASSQDVPSSTPSPWTRLLNNFKNCFQWE